MSKMILGIDPGIADTGFGVIEKGAGGKISCVSYGSIKTKAGMPMASRLETLNDELEKIIKKYRPALAAVEELFFQNNAKTAIIVGQARGVILLACRKNKVPIVELTPLQVKQTISGYGRAEKAQVQKMVKLLLNLKEIPKPDDAADALAIAISAINDLKSR
ncbi:MAG: crossover junction endodeoxyribonuclease RuvC [Patescibacteria group bacterium]|nr:crossover junction endodeoxyribonuclease RuvC [Patescibacteria group bacterium]